MKAIELIEAQQKGKEGTPAYMVGEQLKDICRSEPASADLVEKDLAIESMSLAAAAGKIKAHADELHKSRRGTASASPRMWRRESSGNFTDCPVLRNLIRLRRCPSLRRRTAVS